MSLPILPILAPGTTSPVRNWTWNVKKTPTFNTIQQWTTSGGRLGVPLYPKNPLWEFEFTFGYIKDDITDQNPFYASSIPYTDLQILQAFYLAQLGPGKEFLYQPWNATVTGQALAAVDANNNTELVHTIGGTPDLSVGGNPLTFTVANESVQELNGGSPVIKVGGSPVGGWSLLNPGTVAGYEGYVIHFSSPPGGAITADFTYYYRCVFSDDTQEYENFMFHLAQLNSLKIKQVRVTTG